jgi:hypothetical protein
VSGLFGVLRQEVAADPFHAVATVIFLAAIVHTFAAARIAALAHHAPAGSVRAEVLHFFGEIEVIFGLWAVPLLLAMSGMHGWQQAKHYVNDSVSYTEALFVVVIMALASTRPILGLAESGLKVIAGLAGGTPRAWWTTILIAGPLLGSLITEPAAMTICALLLSRQFYACGPSSRLKYATLGLLFVNVSIGGTLTHFAAPPVLMVAEPWGWGTPFMFRHFGIPAIVAIVLSTAAYRVAFRRELQAVNLRRAPAAVEQPDEEGGPVLLPVPLWVTAIHLAFMAWTVANAHYPVLFVGGFMFFLGFARATAAYQSRVDLRMPLLVGFFLAGLVIHGGLQGWWIAPVLERLTRLPLFFGAMALTAFNDNALITYLATLVPDLAEPLRLAVVAGAVGGGGLTVIANAPNPAGQALLSRHFNGAVAPLGLLAGAALPTLVTIAVFALV